MLQFQLLTNMKNKDNSRKLQDASVGKEERHASRYRKGSEVLCLKNS